MPGEAVLITRFCVFLRGAYREITCTRNCSAPRRGISGFLQGWCSTSKKLGFQWPHAAFATIDSGLLSWGHVLFRRGNALTKKILLHLLHDGSLIFLACRVQPVFVEQHGSGLERLMASALRRARAGEGPVLAWPLACGSTVAERTRAVDFAQGVLRVEVPDVGWRKELQSFAPQYLAVINRYVGESV